MQRPNQPFHKYILIGNKKQTVTLDGIQRRMRRLVVVEYAGNRHLEFLKRNEKLKPQL